MAKMLHIYLLVMSVAAWSSAYTIIPNPTSYIIRKDNHGPVSYAPAGHQGAYYQEQVPQNPQQLPYPLDGVAPAYGYSSYSPEQKIVVPIEEQYPKGDSGDGYYGNSEGYYYPSGVATGHYGDGYGPGLGHVTHGIIGSHDSGVVYGLPHDAPVRYANSEGGDYSTLQHSSYGDKGAKGYNTHDKYKKGEDNDYESKGHQDHYNKGAGAKAAHYGEADQYGSHNAASKGYKDGDFGLEKSHTKGEKTTGFHNVYHKNEYKKDREFYDEADDSGHFKKHGAGATHHGAVLGGYKKTGERDSGYYQDTFGKNGFNKGGTHHDRDSGYHGKSGHDDYFNSHEDFTNKAGSSHGGHNGYKGYGH